jgi:hypothetical protein
MICSGPQTPQTPPKQAWPLPQTLPQAPQLLALLDRSVQTPLQLVCPAAQQTPVVLPGGIAQEPLAQTPLDEQLPPGGTPVQVPPVQVLFGPQTVPQAP